MSSIIGFTIYRDLPSKNLESALSAQHRALSYFKHLEHSSFSIGESRLELWGHKELSDRVHFLPDGSMLALVGSPCGKVAWSQLQERLATIEQVEKLELPWDGRYILLMISADGKRWIMWNDWLGSIPVFHTQLKHGLVVSTLEPVVVAGGGFTSNDLFLPGLIYLLIHGNFLSDWTLFKDMKIVLPDSVAEWNEKGFVWKRLFTIKPTNERWETGWDDLVDEMHYLSRQAIVDVLKTRSSWILPLSSGLDSRLIAGVGAELGIDIHTYTWGSRASGEVVYARQIAHALKLPWKWIDLGKDYLVQYATEWADLFGSSMHFHGMYQMSFLDALEDSEPFDPIVSGFIGESLAGYDVHFQSDYHSYAGRRYQSHPDGYVHWLAKDIPSLLRIPVDKALEQIAFEIETQSNLIPGPWFQRLRFLTLWGRQHHFTYFQSTLCDYWRGVVTPYMNRAYARFCLSLPRAALDERRLQGDVFRRYYGKLAVIPGSYATEPFISSGRYLLKRRISKFLPRFLRNGFLQDLDSSQLTTDVKCVQCKGRDSFRPLFEARERLRDLLDWSLIEAAYNLALAGDMKSVRKLQSVQALAYQLLNI